MRLTVGPLPPAVYWRRRAVVLGAGLLFLLVVLYSCGDPNSGASPKGDPSASSSVGSKPTAVLTPETESPPPPEVNQPGNDASTAATPSAGGTVPSVAPPPDGSCTDAEVSVVPVPARTSVRSGTAVDLHLKIKNVSERTCSRDLGADLQEIYLRLGATVVWSSDTCGTARGHEVKSLTPNVEHEYTVTWNGRDASKCAGGLAAGDPPGPGDYQLFGRLGTKRSDPVTLKITG
ncbi:hypothetical protein AB0J86_11500 [Micromonospora sp. NPDC049559]|uniref:hypothetical protein n=1 Tax=Micromonospora sp. NPDC049559 TaxID=3155923 RepID=UPI0034423B79